jgi:hypothetical protein
MASLEWERSSDRPVAGTPESAPVGEGGHASLAALLAEAGAASQRVQQAAAEIARDERVTATAHQEPSTSYVDRVPIEESAPSNGHSAADWISETEEAAVERLFALLEQNQVAIAALAQAWRHTRRALQLTQARLAYTERLLAAERHEFPPTTDQGLTA